MAGLALLPASCGGPSEPVDTGYDVEVLGNLTGPACCSEALAINGDGVVVGWNSVGDPYGLYGGGRAFRWSPGTGLEDLGTLSGGRGALAYDINERGDIVGFGIDSAGRRHPVLWAQGVLTDLAGGACGSYDCGTATAVNDSGRVAGWRQDSTGSLRAFIWQGGQIEDLEPSGALQQVLALNNRGQAVGVGLSGQAASGGILWDGTQVRFVGPLSGAPYGQTTPLAINDAGQVVGWGYGANYRERGFLYQDGSLQELPTLGGHIGHASGISRVGEIVGGAQDGSGIYRAVVWRDLRPMALPLPPGAASAQARDINSDGVIVGLAVWDSPTTAGPPPVQAVVWTPIRR